MLVTLPLLRGEAVFFPLHPFTLFENGRQVYASPQAAPVQLSPQDIDRLPTVTAGRRSYHVLCHGKDKFPALLAQVLNQALQGAEDHVPMPFFYLYTAYCRSVFSELFSHLRAEPSILPACYAIKHSIAFFITHTLMLLHSVGVCGMRPLSLKQQLQGNRIVMTTVFEMKSLPTPEAEQHPLRVLSKSIVEKADMQEKMTFSESTLSYSLSAPHVPFKEELASPYTWMFHQDLLHLDPDSEDNLPTPFEGKSFF